MRKLLWLSLLLLPFLLACSEPRETPEQRIRVLIAQGEEAAEARDLDFFAALISPGYSDADGRTRREILRMMTGYFMRNRSIHLLLRIEEVTLLEGARARTVLHVGMAGSPVDGFQQLLALRASIYRMELTFKMDDDIRLLHAQWRRINPEEVLQKL